MPMKVPPTEVLAAFNSLPPNASTEALMNFTTTYFYPAGYEVRSIVPSDWDPNPSFLTNIKDPTLQAWALSVHSKWRNLVPYPFVVAGGRFMEYYYWDSMWIVDGLLVSGMLNTTKNFISNFLYLVKQFGFIPNGGRVYYLDRSQPPVLTQLVRKYFEATNDTNFLTSALPILDQEYRFWAQNRNVSLYSHGQQFFLNNYNVTNSLPRPESYYNDVQTAQAVPQADRAALYGEIATGAETGWDFSSRWFKDGFNLSTIEAKNVIPVDLNSILYANEATLRGWHAAAGNTAMAAYYDHQATARRTAIKEFLWNERLEMWTDYNHVANAQSSAFYPSNFTPIWANASDLTQAEIASVLQRNANFWTSYPAGVPTSMTNSTQQWDFPNAWPPLQYWIIEALRSQPKTQSIAASLVQQWITTNYCAWNLTGGNVSGIMFEKYNALAVGQPGQGGEYAVQDGFGWTNGVALHYLNIYGKVLTLHPCPPSDAVRSVFFNGDHMPVGVHISNDDHPRIVVELENEPSKEKDM